MQFSSLLGHVQALISIIRESDKPADGLIESFFRSRKYLGSHDRRFIAETTYGILRHLRNCDDAVRRALAGTNYRINEDDGLLLLILVYLQEVENKRNLPLVHVAARFKNPDLRQSFLDVLARATLADSTSTRSEAEELAVKYSYPDWIIQRLIGEFGADETSNLCESLNKQAPLTLRVNTLKGSVEECQEQLRKEGVETERTRYSPWGLTIPQRLNVFTLTAFRNGMFEVQDEGSQLISLMLDPKPSARVLDACAGAGGKTLALAAIMQNRGELYAADTLPRRLDELRKRARRAGAFNIRVLELDSLEKLVPERKEYFHLVLVDAPCSGLGTIRRNPGIKWSAFEQSVEELSAKQQHILRAVGPLVRQGGVLAYATCTLTPEENKKVIEDFLGSESSFETIDPAPKAEQLGISSAVRAHAIQLLPHLHDTDAFFFVMMRRSRNGSD